MTVPTVSPAQLAEIYQGGKQIDLIDVRTPVEFREVQVEFARNVPLDRLDPAALAVPSGAVEIVRRQQDGYGYFKP